MTDNSELNIPSRTTDDSKNLPKTAQVESIPSQLLAPWPPLRRPSYASVLSDLSDLDYMSNHHDNVLLRTTSNISTCSTTGPLTFRQRLVNLYHQNYGALLVLLSQIFGAGMNICARLLEQNGGHGPPMHPFQILFVRQLLTTALCTTYALTTKSIPHFPLGPPDRTVRLLLVSRGLCGFFGVVGLYFSLVTLPLSEATVLTFLVPILTCYLCSLVLPNSTFTRQQQAAGLISFIGVLFVANPSSSPTTSTPNQHLLAILVGMVGVLGSTGAMTSIRAIGTRAHAFISVNYFSSWCCVISLVALLVLPDVPFRIPANPTEWALLLALGLCGFVMQGLLTRGLSYGGPAARDSSAADDGRDDLEARHPKTRPTPSANRATSMVYMQMLFAIVADKVVFGTSPVGSTWVGIGLILAGAIWVAAANGGGKSRGWR